jgi:hypothetical protein
LTFLFHLRELLSRIITGSFGGMEAKDKRTTLPDKQQRPTEEIVQADGPRSSTPPVLFVGGLSIRTSRSNLLAYMQNYGKVLKLDLQKKGGVSKGYAFLQFEDEAVAERVVNDSHKLDGRKFTCVYSVDSVFSGLKIEEEKKRKLYLYDLPPKCTETDIEAYFSTFGKVEWATILRDKDGHSKRNGFVKFAESEVVDWILSRQSNLHSILGWEVKVFKCLSKKEIRQHSRSKSPNSDGILHYKHASEQAGGYSRSLANRAQQGSPFSYTGTLSGPSITERQPFNTSMRFLDSKHSLDKLGHPVIISKARNAQQSEGGIRHGQHPTQPTLVLPYSVHSIPENVCCFSLPVKSVYHNVSPSLLCSTCAHNRFLFSLRDNAQFSSKYYRINNPR